MVHRYYVCEPQGHRIVYSLLDRSIYPSRRCQFLLSFHLLQAQQRMRPFFSEVPHGSWHTLAFEVVLKSFRANKCETYSDILPVGTCSSKLLHEDISANTWVSFNKGRCNETCSGRGEVMFPRVYVIWVSLIFCISAIHLQVLHNSMPVFSLMIPEGI